LGVAQQAIYQVDNPVPVDSDERLRFRLHFRDSQWKRNSLGHFRLSVSDDPGAYANAENRLAAMKIADPWAKLAAVYFLRGNRQAHDKLLEQHPQAAAGIGDLYAMKENWQRAIEFYSKSLTNQNTDATLLSRRAAAYIAIKQYGVAGADLRRAIELQPSLAETEFDRYKSGQRWSEAAEWGSLLIQQQPENTILWVQVPPVAVLSENDAVYPAVCRTILELFRKAPTEQNFDRAIKGCLLKPGAIDLSELPLDFLTMSLDETSVPDWLPPWFWSTRALLAYRSGDAKSAVENVTKSEQYQPTDHCHALNLPVLAMAEHELKHPDEARKALDEAGQLIERLQSSDRTHHDLLIAEILFREAEAKLGGKEDSAEETSTTHGKSTTTPAEEQPKAISVEADSDQDN
jgi:hypothetical protein